MPAYGPLRTSSSAARTGLVAFVIAFGLGALAPRLAHADRITKLVDKLVELNKKGMDDLDIAEFESARKAFFAAEEMGRRAGLEEHPVMARTYIHLGALALLGYKDKAKAAEYFEHALAMQPDIELDKSLRLGAVGALFQKVQKDKTAPAGASAASRTSSSPAPSPSAESTKPRPRKTAEQDREEGDSDDNDGAGPTASGSESSPTQWTWWLGGGGGRRGVGARASALKNVGVARLGAAASFGLAGMGDQYELRWGPWLMAETQFDGLLGEGGVELAVAPVRVARLAYGLRLGGGYGKDKLGGAPEVSATLMVGTRSLAGGGDEDDAEDEQGDGDDEKPKRKGQASSTSGRAASQWANGIRAFFTFRNPPPKSGHGLSFLLGVEITPALFLPPYTKQRWLGGE